ncbi:hypothetical protein CLU79DRAFT_420615 [Phycomyces nitens]|nr:hypothetical protein CLU79DRAFT_420615 [Phycomyces nitens]
MNGHLRAACPYDPEPTKHSKNSNKRSRRPHTMESQDHTMAGLSPPKMTTFVSPPGAASASIHNPTNKLGLSKPKPKPKSNANANANANDNDSYNDNDHTSTDPDDIAIEDIELSLHESYTEIESDTVMAQADSLNNGGRRVPSSTSSWTKVQKWDKHTPEKHTLAVVTIKMSAKGLRQLSTRLPSTQHTRRSRSLSPRNTTRTILLDRQQALDAEANSTQ